jgi:protein required for attachment to host cells
MHAPTTWVVLADRSRARFMRHRGPGKGFDLVQEMEHPDGRLRDREIMTDRPGRAFDRSGQGRHAMEPEESPHEHEAAAFARTVADYAARARLDHRFERLVVAAEPQFLGLLRAALDEPTKKLVVGELPKHLLASDEQDVAKVLASVMNV